MGAITDSLPGWALIALVLFWFVGAYNRLVRLRAVALQAYAQLDAALVRQLEFVQADAGSPANPVAPVDVAGTSSLQAAAAQLATLLGATRVHPLDADAIGALTTAVHVLVTAWQRQHPEAAVSDVGGEGGMTSIPWPESSGMTEMARGQFNAAVTQYNAAVSQFPAVLIAWLFRLRRSTPLR